MPCETDYTLWSLRCENHNFGLEGIEITKFWLSGNKPSIPGVDMSIPESLCLLGVNNLSEFDVYTGQGLKGLPGTPTSHCLCGGGVPCELR